MGDFNEILLAEEKQEWLDRLERQILAFRDALNYSGLKDLGFSGFPFIWCNRRPRAHNVWIQLDRVVATIDWMLQFPTTHIHHLDAFHSGHKPILLCTDSEFKRFYRKGHPFRFEAMWTKDDSCEGVIRDSCEPAREEAWVVGFNKKFLSCQENLKVWN